MSMNVNNNPFGGLISSIENAVQDAGEAISAAGQQAASTVEGMVDGLVDTVEHVSQQASAPVTQNAISLPPVVDEFLNAAGQAFSRAGASLADAGEEVVGGLQGAGHHIAKGFMKSTVEAGSKLLRGDVIGAGRSFFTGLDHMSFQAGLRLTAGLIDATEDILQAPLHLVPDPVGQVGRDLVARYVDVGRTLVNTPAQMQRSLYYTAWETPLEFMQGMGEAGSLLLQGRLSEAAGKAGEAVAGVGIRLAGEVVTQSMIALQGAADVISVGLFISEPSRELTPEEKAFLREEYGDSVDLDLIRVHRGNITTEWLGMAAHTVGNDIYVPNDPRFADGSKVPIYAEDGSMTTPDGLILLTHETAHAWQSQNSGNDYIHESLFAQGFAVVSAFLRNGTVTPEDRNAAYEWQDSADSGVAFEDLNPEQQAHVIEAHAAARVEGETGASDTLSSDDEEYVQVAMGEVRSGESAA